MSETVDLKNVLLNATEATSLADTDRLMAFGSDGGLKKIGRGNLLATLLFGKSATVISAPTGIYSFSQWIYYVSKEIDDWPNTTYMTRGKIMHQIGKLESENRTVDYYGLVLGPSADKANRIDVIPIMIIIDGMMPIWNPNAAESLKKNWGGVNASYPMHYKFQQKGGGLRDGRNNGTYQQFAEKSDARRDGVSWICRRRYRKLQGLWRIPVGCKKHFVHNADSYARMELRLYGGDVSGRRHHAANNPSTRQIYLGQGASSWTVATVVSDYADRGDIIASERRAA